MSNNTNNAITITTGTGAELAAAVKNILITQRQERHQHQQQPRQRSSSTASMMAQEEGRNIVFAREEEEVPDQLDDDNDDGLANITEEGVHANNDSNAANTNISEIDAEANAKFFAQRFKTEWESCLQRATADFDRAMKLFWCEVRIFVFHIVDKRVVSLSFHCCLCENAYQPTINFFTQPPPPR